MADTSTYADRVQKILLPTDFSDCARAALTQAIFLANQFDAELHLLHVVELHDDDPFHPSAQFPDADELYSHLVKIAQSEMKKLLAEGKGHSLRVHEHQVRALSAAPAILELIEEESIDLVVMGAHGRRGLRRFFLGSVAEEVVRSAACPVLTTRESDRDPLEAIERVLAPVDFSDESAHALGLARELAALYQAKLDVVHVLENPTLARPYDPVIGHTTALAFPQAAPKLEGSLGQFIDEVGGPDVEIQAHVLEGNPANTIVAAAREQGAGLIVIATHGLTGLEHFLLGSVTERVVRTADCPVLTLHAPADDGDENDD